MNRFKRAWLAFFDRLPVHSLLGNPQIVSVFVRVNWGNGPNRYYATCQQAHESHPTSQIQKADLLQIDGKLYRFPYDGAMWPVELQPKPKRPKGKARG